MRPRQQRGGGVGQCEDQEQYGIKARQKLEKKVQQKRRRQTRRAGGQDDNADHAGGAKCQRHDGFGEPFVGEPPASASGERERIG